MPRHGDHLQQQKTRYDKHFGALLNDIHLFPATTHLVHIKRSQPDASLLSLLLCPSQHSLRGRVSTAWMSRHPNHRPLPYQHTNTFPSLFLRHSLALFLLPLPSSSVTSSRHDAHDRRGDVTSLGVRYHGRLSFHDKSHRGVGCALGRWIKGGRRTISLYI